ncbi:hypothetical protein N7507_008454 [Penicillium longicatenatum]|nr:hypothetical protein N7507_008454 [Penicillium longicatenatum]
MTRCQTLEFLVGVTRLLNLVPDDKLHTISWDADRAAYDAWLTWAVESIADWEHNIFLGYGSGDKGGEALDFPCTFWGNDEGLMCATAQLNTCLKASMRLLSVLHTLGEWFEKQFTAHYPERWMEGYTGKAWSEADHNVPVRNWEEVADQGNSSLKIARQNLQPSQRISFSLQGSFEDSDDEDSDYRPGEGEGEMEEERDWE